MLRAYLYDSTGKDQEIDLDKGLPKLSSTRLLWIDITGREPVDIKRVAELLSLQSVCSSDLASKQNVFAINTYGEYLHFDVRGLVIKSAHKNSLPAIPRPVRLDFIVSKLWLVTVHEEPLVFLEEFRQQDRGDTLIGKLSPAALASALLDWHLGPYLAATEQFEDFCDKLDERILGVGRFRRNMLPEIVGARRYISDLRRLLVPQRAVFYGLSRADVALLTDVENSDQFKSLEHRFERALDIVEHGRDLVRATFDLYSTRIAEDTNVLIRRLTFISIILGAIGSVAGIFGMNFDTPFSHTGLAGFWTVLLVLSLGSLAFALFSWWKKWL